MEQQVEIKEEPVWFERAESTSYENYKLKSEMTDLQEEIKSDFAEPEETQVNTVEPFSDVKDEICVEEHTVGELGPCLKEEDIVDNVEVSTRLVNTSDICSNVLKAESDSTCPLSPHTGEQPYRCNEQLSHSEERLFLPNKVSLTFDDVKQIPSPHRETLYRSRECGNTSHKQRMLSNKGIVSLSCNVCGRSFARKFNLEQHILVHTGERPHRCPECGKTFQMKTNLNLHRLIHTGERPHICETCGKSFPLKSTLKTHTLLHTGERPFICNECGRSYLQKSNLKFHLLTHTGQRPYGCIQCGKSFSQKSTLLGHMKIHSGVRLHHCNECGKCFSRKANLRIHMLIHTGDRPHCCSECGKRFISRSNLNQHFSTHASLELSHKFTTNVVKRSNNV